MCKADSVVPWLMVAPWALAILYGIAAHAWWARRGFKGRDLTDGCFFWAVWLAAVVAVFIYVYACWLAGKWS